MKMVRSVIASTITAAVFATSATPAMAQGYPGAGYNNGYVNRGYDRSRHHNRGVSAGDVIAGVAIIGVLAAIASAASKSNNRNGGYRSNINSEDQAAEACASRVEQRYGNSARVRNIDDVQRTRDGYEVRGAVETSDRYDRGTQRFTCSVRYGQVEDVRVDSGYAYRGY
jgi:Tfp pilus assembly protein PilE